MCEFRLFVCFASSRLCFVCKLSIKGSQSPGQAWPDANQPLLLSASFMYFGLAQSYGAII